MKKRICFACLLLCVVLCGAAGAQGDEELPTIRQQNAVHNLFVSGKDLKDWVREDPTRGYVYLDENKRTMVPLRAVAEAMGLEVAWDGTTQSITIEGGTEGTVVFHAGSPVYTVNGQTLEMDTTPVILGNRVHVPLRFVAESAGGTVRVYKSATESRSRIAVFFSRDNVTPTPPPWAEDDYVTFTDTSAYMPENWAKIQDLRARAEAGENVWDETTAFGQNFSGYDLTQAGEKLDRGYYDAGVGYECTLLFTKLHSIGFCNPEKCATGNMKRVNTEFLSGDQLASATRWNLRLLGAGETGMPERFNSDLLNLYFSKGVRDERFDPVVAQILNGGRAVFLRERWFKGIDTSQLLPLLYVDHFARNSIVSDAYGEIVHNTYGDKDGFACYDLLSGLGYRRDRDANQQDPKQETYRRGDETIVLEEGKNSVLINGRTVPLGVSLKRGLAAILVPPSFITEVLGQTLSYDADNAAYFVGKPENFGSSNLKAWTLAMSATMAIADGDSDPYLFGMFHRGYGYVKIPDDSNPFGSRLVLSRRSDAAGVILENSWGCKSGDDIRTQVSFLIERSKHAKFPAWDLFRVAHLASWGYAAEYLTGEEALSLVEPAAKGLHDKYSNWDEAYDDYLNGYAQWGGSAVESDSIQRRTWYEELKAAQPIYEPFYGLLFDDSLFQTPVRGL